MSLLDTDRSADLDAAAHDAAEANALHTCRCHCLGMFPKLAVITSPWTGQQVQVPMGILPPDVRRKIDNAAGGSADFTMAELRKIADARRLVADSAKRANSRMHGRLLVRRGRYGR